MLEPAPTDGMVVAAVLAGEREQFAHLVERYHGPLFRLALNRLGRPDWAEDAVQEAFLNAFRWLKSYDSKFSFRTWLWTILLNQCRALGKRQARHSGTGEPARAEPLVCPAPSPADQAASREYAEQLHALLSRLPDPQADALRLRFFGDLTFPEIAAAMECSISGAKLRVRTGLTQLTAWLADAPNEHLRPAGERINSTTAEDV